MDEVNAEIIAVGTELLLGEITDTNSVYIARALRDLGINLYFMTSVGDNQRRISSAVTIALSRAQIVIVCGGLGPTVDDVTREGIADAVQRPLVFHQSLLESIRERFAGFQVKMTENNARQAYAPEGAIIVENPVGTAPSFIVELEEKIVLALPGVPREMKYLFTEKIIPFLREKYALGETVIIAKVLKAAGIGESMLDDALGKELLEGHNPTVGLAAHSGQVDIRITAKARSLEEANAMIAITEADVRRRVGGYIFGTDNDTLEAALINLVNVVHGSIAVREIGIQPILTQRLSAAGLDLPQSKSEPADFPALVAQLGMSEHDSLRAIAEQLAKHAATQENASVGIALISRDNDESDHPDKEELSALAVYCNGGIRSRAYGFGGSADVANQFMSMWALSMAWRMLKEAHVT